MLHSQRQSIGLKQSLNAAQQLLCIAIPADICHIVYCPGGLQDGCFAQAALSAQLHG